jgi:hypothetical protein
VECNLELNYLTFERPKGWDKKEGHFVIVDKLVYTKMKEFIEGYRYALHVTKSMPNFEPLEKLKMLRKIEEIKEYENFI